MPPARPDSVARPHLIDQLNKGIRDSHCLTLVSAPAGYGKTTLVAAWLQQPQSEPQPRHAWLSLEKDDNDLARFFAYLVVALEEAGVRMAADDRRLWEESSLPPVKSLVTALLNEISREEQPSPLLLVLDDYHKIQTPAIHLALQFWLEHAPAHLHLVLITREDPPFPLSRWRVQGRMTEIRVGDLRFTAAEAAAFLGHSTGLSLSPENVAALEQRTEGWIAGLQLAAIALQSSQAQGKLADSADFVGDFIAAFSGSHHYVIDYLVEEVLRQEDEFVRDFLRMTAVLERMNASVCDAITEGTNSQEILGYLERRNLFLVPLDNRRHWYRYHHLLADSLRARLDEATLRVLHQRAARWYEENGYANAAVNHALSSQDLPWAADMMARVIQRASTWSQGQVGELIGWLEALPPALLQARPELSLHASRALYLHGQPERAAQLVEQAEAAMARSDQGEFQALRRLAAVYRAAIASLRGTELDEAIVSMQNLLESVPISDPHTAARATFTLGMAHEMKGDVVIAAQVYAQAAELAQVAGVDYLAINARCAVALMQIRQGRFLQARHTCQDALQSTPDIAPSGLAHSILGYIALERNELALAEERLLRGIDLSKQGDITEDLRYGYLYLVRLRQAQGDGDAALAAWQQADRIAQAYNIPRLIHLSAADRARLDLAQGNLALARRWAAEYERYKAETQIDYVHEVADLTLARIWLADQAAQKSLIFAKETIARAQAAGRGRTVLEGRIVQTLAHHALGDRPAALASLTEALTLAAPEGIVRLFLDEGQAIAQLLPHLPPVAPAFVEALGHAFGVETGAASPPSKPPPQPTEPPAEPLIEPLIEPLTEQEENVLKLLVAGYSNREIAQELVITLGTAKWHVHNLYQKLDVSNRGQAIAQAHERHLV